MQQRAVPNAPHPLDIARRRYARLPAYVRELMDEYEASPERIYFNDQMPEIVTQSAFFGAAGVSPSSISVKGRLIPNRQIRIGSLIGIGDAFWTRGIVRGHLDKGFEVWVQTPCPWAFWDFEPEPRFHLDGPESPQGLPTRTATYLTEERRAGFTIYSAMCERCHVSPQPDFKMPIHPGWNAAADRLLAKIAPGKPICLYRPLVRNHARKSVSSRNPDPDCYQQIFDAVRKDYHVISIADIKYGESLAHAGDADTVFHNGEIPLTTLAALMTKAAFTYTSPGMALVMACAVGAPVVGVFGGYEDAHNYEDTAIYGPSLLIDPIEPCMCMADNHACKKAIDVPRAIERLKQFTEQKWKSQ